MWRKIQRKNFYKATELSKFLEIDIPLVNNKDFPLNVPYRLAAKIEKGNPLDPIFLQFVPQVANKSKDRTDQPPLLDPVSSSPASPSSTELFQEDPVDDKAFRKAPRLLHKYQGRVLLLTTSACAMHCRYCFRQNFPYETKAPFTKELDYIKKDPSIREVILSGGDPLSLSNDALEKILYPLDAISHVKLIRFHTRFPIGIPERIDTSFLQMLERLHSQVTFVIHTNHPKELDDQVLYHLSLIQRYKIPVINQSVLLKGVNDNFTSLYDLSMKLVSNGIMPYYLHQLDKVTGTEHFAVTNSQAFKLLEQLRESLPGYAVPKLVQEIPHKSSKTPLYR